MASHADEELQDERFEIKTDRGWIHATASRRAAVSAALFAIGWPGGFVILLMAFVGIASNSSPMGLLLGIIYGLLIVAVVTIVAGYSIGWFAHHWFYETKTSPKRMATVIALIFDTTIVGWALVAVFCQTAMR